MWEIMARQRPYLDLDFGPNGRNLRKSICDGKRPDTDCIPDSMHSPPYVALMRLCWSADPAHRPPFSEIYPALLDLPRGSPSAAARPPSISL